MTDNPLAALLRNAIISGMRIATETPIEQVPAAIADVLAALSRALDPALTERAGEVLEGVTPGPWVTGTMLPFTVFNPNPKDNDDSGVICDCQEPANARFIAWCREGVLALLAQNAALRAEQAETLKAYKIRLFSAEAERDALRAERDEAYAYAKHLVEAIFANGKFDAPQWKPLEDTLGVLTQIDNMVAGIRARAEAAEAKVKKLRRERDDALTFLDNAVSNAPQPLKALGKYLAGRLDEDEWQTAEQYLNAAAKACVDLTATEAKVEKLRGACLPLQNLDMWTESAEDTEMVIVSVGTVRAIRAALTTEADNG